MFVFTSKLITAQEIPNGNFESWNSIPLFEQPDGWFNSNWEIYPSLNVIKDNITNPQGNYAVHLSTIKTSTDTIFGFVANAKLENDQFLGGVPFTEIPDSFKALISYNCANNDSAVILIIFKKDGNPISSDTFYLYGTQLTYSEISFKLSSLSINPDTVVVGFVSSNPFNEDMTKNPGNFLKVDSVRFTNVSTQIPNADFENWSYVSLELINNWNVLINMLSLSSIGEAIVTKTTDKYEGEYAVNIKTLAFKLQDEGIDTLGLLLLGNLNLETLEITGGFPLKSFKPDSLQFYYKYDNSGNINDSAFFGIRFNKLDTNLNKSTTVDSYYVKLASASVYTPYSIIFDTGMVIPDSANILLSSSDLFLKENSGIGNNLTIDNIVLFYHGLGNSLIPEQLIQGIIYPNPAKNYINLRFYSSYEGTGHEMVRILDLEGKILKEFHQRRIKQGENIYQVKLDNIPNGTYLLSIGYKDKNYFVRKFVTH